MKFKVIARHYNSRNCFICGIENPAGLQGEFYELEDGRLAGVFTPRQEHQSYPTITHGGVLSAILDETIGRAINITEPQTFALTAELNVRFKKPVNLDTRIVCLGRITLNNSRIYEAEGEIYNPDGQVATTATARFVKMPAGRITAGTATEEVWRVDLENELEFLEV